MELLKEIAEWKSIRRYKDEPLPSDVILTILEAARRAPSWENYQPWNFIVITNPEVKSILKDLTGGQSFVTKAPVVICACADLNDFTIEKARERLSELMASITGKEQPSEFIEEKFLSKPLMTPVHLGEEIVLARALEQLSYAVSFMIIQAAHLGVGCCVVGAFGNRATKQFPELYHELITKLNLPETIIPLVLVPMGYPAEEPNQRPRKPLKSIIYSERFGVQFTT